MANNTNVQDIDLLIEELTKLKRAAEHAEFYDAIKKLLEDEAPAPGCDLLGVGSDVVLAYVAATYTVDMDVNYNLILRDGRNSPCNRWENGEWIDV